MFYKEDFDIHGISDVQTFEENIEVETIPVVNGYVTIEGNRAPMHIDNHDYTSKALYKIVIPTYEIACDYASAIRQEGQFILEDCVAKVDISTITITPISDEENNVTYVLSYVVHKDVWGDIMKDIETKQVVGEGNEDIFNQS